MDSSNLEFIEIDFDLLYSFYANDDREKVLNEIRRILRFFEKNIITKETQSSNVVLLNRFLSFLFVLFAQDNFQLQEDEARELLNYNPLIANLTKISGINTTDFPVLVMSKKNDSIFKILILYNNISHLETNFLDFFKINKSFAFLWFYKIFNHFFLIEEKGYQRLTSIVAAITKDFHFDFPFLNYSHIYFDISYFENNKEELIKNKINDLYKDEKVIKLKLSNGVTKRKIAILSNKLQIGTAVFKCLCASMATIMDSFEVTLITSKEYSDEELTNLEDHLKFQKIIQIKPIEVDVEDIQKIYDQNFDIIFYPDVGMTRESIVLSNKRLAPIQITSYGHPVSTFNSEIDYWFGGQAVEHPTKAPTQYSERLLLLPGLGIQSVYPVYEKKHLTLSRDKFIIGCSWSTMKINHPLILMLKRIIARVPKKNLVFRFFPYSGIREMNTLLAWTMDLERILGAQHVEVFADLDAMIDDVYMRRLEEVDFAIDSYPFGGFNTVTDALYLHKPVVAFEGDRAFNRFASAILRLMGLDELIATSWETYENLIVQLINDDIFRKTIQEKITEEKFGEMIQKSTDPSAFRRAIDYLIENHERLQDNPSCEPIIIN